MSALFALELSRVECANCFITFAIPMQMERARREDHESFLCPNGHSLSWGSEGPEAKATRLRLEAEREAENQRTMRHVAEHEATQAQKAVRRLRRRAAGGACPCCNRTFIKLSRHMKTKHPTFGGAV